MTAPDIDLFGLLRADARAAKRHTVDVFTIDLRYCWLTTATSARPQEARTDASGVVPQQFAAAVDFNPTCATYKSRVALAC
jgi:hypothetical protein